MNAPLTAALAAVLASGLTAVLVSYLPSPPDEAAEAATASGPRPAAASPGGSASVGADAAMAASAALERVAALEMELASLRELVERKTPQRAAVMSEEDIADARQAASLMPDDASRALILDVLAQKEEEERRTREEEIRQRMAERLLERADEVAAELGLNRTDRDALHSVLVEESTRRSALFESMRETGFGGDRESIRSEMEALNTWKEQELISRFGEDLGNRVDEMTEERGRRGGFGGRGGGGGEDGGRGGNGGRGD